VRFLWSIPIALCLALASATIAFAQNPVARPPVAARAARAAILVASQDDPQHPVANLGSTVWSTIPRAPGQPATIAVKAEADIPDLKMHATMTLRKNTDPTLQATHTIDLKFSFADGAPITGFKDVGLPQMRKEDSTAGEELASVKLKISNTYFLIALAKGESDAARNLDLMQTRAWFDFPLLLNDDRIAKMVFQKSPEGRAMLDKAFEAWKVEAPPSPATLPSSMSLPAKQAPPEPPVLDSGATVVPMVSEGGTFVVPVKINDQITLNFIVDSGASDVAVPADVVSTLVRTGTITDADRQVSAGRRRSSRTLLARHQERTPVLDQFDFVRGKAGDGHGDPVLVFVFLLDVVRRPVGANALVEQVEEAVEVAPSSDSKG
jgi:Aspartyl protease